MVPEAWLLGTDAVCVEDTVPCSRIRDLALTASADEGQSAGVLPCVGDVILRPGFCGSCSLGLRKHFQYQSTARQPSRTVQWVRLIRRNKRQQKLPGSKQLQGSRLSSICEPRIRGKHSLPMTWCGRLVSTDQWKVDRVFGKCPVTRQARFSSFNYMDRNWSA